MKVRIIDILNQMADGTLEDGFKFKDGNHEYIYDEKSKDITDENGSYWGDNYALEFKLADEVEVIEDVKEIEPVKRQNTGITTITTLRDVADKVDELVQAVNELRKEKE